MNPTPVIFVSQVFILVFSILVILTWGKGRFRDYGFNIPDTLHLRTIVPLALAYGIVATLASAACTPAGLESSTLSGWSLLAYIAAVWVAASVCEEILFRGVVQTNLAARTKGRSFEVLGAQFSVASVLAAVLFALDHLITWLAMGAPAANLVIVVLFSLTIGVTAGYYRDKTGSLIPAIIIHSLANIGGDLVLIVVALFE